MQRYLKELVKSAARSVAFVLVLPALVSFALRAALWSRDRALQGSTQMLALVPGIVGQYVRCAFLRRALDHCHKTVVVEFGTIFSRAGARLDDYAYVGPHCHLGLVHIERDALLAAGVHVPSGPHSHSIEDLSRPIRERPGAERLVSIGAGSWIGEAAVVMANVGRETVVGAGAVVTRPLPARVVAAGVPARVLRIRDSGAARAV